MASPLEALVGAGWPDGCSRASPGPGLQTPPAGSTPGTLGGWPLGSCGQVRDEFQTSVFMAISRLLGQTKNWVPLKAAFFSYLCSVHLKEKSTGL